MMRHSFYSAALLSALLSWSGQSLAQEQPKSLELFKKMNGNQDIFAYDFGVPQSPGLLLLGLQSGSVVPASTLKALVGQIGNVVGGAGTTVALEITPAALFGGGRDLLQYASNGNYMYRLVRRTHIGVAGLLGSTGDKPVKSGVSLGVTVSLLDSSDPWRAKSGNGVSSLVSCIDTATEPLVPVFLAATDNIALPDDMPAYLALENAQSRLFAAARNPGTRVLFTEQEVGALSILGISANSATDYAADSSNRQTLLSQINEKKAALRKKAADGYVNSQAATQAVAGINKCVDTANENARQGTDLKIGVGTFWRGKPGEFAELRNAGGAGWAAFRTTFATNLKAGTNVVDAAWLIAASSRYAWRETVATGDAARKDISANTLDGWIGIERQQEDLLLSARIGYQQVRATDLINRTFNNNGTRFLLNAQARVDEQVWLSLSYGNAGGSIETLNARRVLVNVSFSPPKRKSIVSN